MPKNLALVRFVLLVFAHAFPASVTLSAASEAIPARQTAEAPLQTPPRAQDNPVPPEVQKAIELAQKGDPRGAIALVEPLAKKPGAHPFLPSLLGSLYLQAERPAEALAVLAPLADKAEAGPIVLYHAARAARATGKDEAGERYLVRAAALAPDSPAARDLGLILGAQGRTEEAYALLSPWTRAHPDDGEARLAAAYCAVELERVAEAERLVAGLPEADGRTRLLRGRTRLIGQDPRAALVLLTDLVRTGSADLQRQARRFAAIAHLALGESKEAAALLAGQVGDDPSLAVLLARAQLRSGDAALAATTLEPFAKALPPAASPPGELALAAEVALETGRVLVAAGRFAEAQPALEKATRWAPLRAEGWQLLGQAQMASGQREEATASLNRFRELQGAAQKVSQQVDEADAERKDPTRRTLREAAALAAQGKVEEALGKLRRESAFAPDDPRPKKAEIELLVAAGRKGEAIERLKARVAAHPEDTEAAARLKELGPLP
jgi:predicted Zn-dependent protease